MFSDPAAAVVQVELELPQWRVYAPPWGLLEPLVPGGSAVTSVSGVARLREVWLTGAWRWRAGAVWLGGTCVALLPGEQVHQGDRDGVTRNQRVPEQHWRGNYQYKSSTYTGDGFLKANGCMASILSPLSQVILARLAFLSSASWSSAKGAGLAAES